MKSLSLLLLAGMIGMAGCASKTAPVRSMQPVGLDASPTVSVEDVPQERLEFKRIYRTTINSNVSLKIDVRWFIGEVWFDGELTQTGGRWVTFDPKDPADKILDRDILPIVQRKCDEIIAMDKQFRSSNPGRFTDESGQVWIREGK